MSAQRAGLEAVPWTNTTGIRPACRGGSRRARSPASRRSHCPGRPAAPASRTATPPATPRAPRSAPLRAGSRGRRSRWSRCRGSRRARCGRARSPVRSPCERRVDPQHGGQRHAHQRGRPGRPAPRPAAGASSRRAARRCPAAVAVAQAPDLDLGDRLEVVELASRPSRSMSGGRVTLDVSEAADRSRRCRRARACPASCA